jgi:hypothetical protein
MATFPAEDLVQIEATSFSVEALEAQDFIRNRDFYAAFEVHRPRAVPVPPTTYPRHLMRGLKVTEPRQHVFWETAGGPDLQAARSGYAEGEIEDVVVIRKILGERG